MEATDLINVYKESETMWENKHTHSCNTKMENIYFFQ